MCDLETKEANHIGVYACKAELALQSTPPTLMSFRCTVGKSAVLSHLGLLWMDSKGKRLTRIFFGGHCVKMAKEMKECGEIHGLWTDGR